MIINNAAARKEFKKLAYPHMALLYNVALKYCGNEFDAEDIVQETYLMAFDKFHQLRDKSKCKPWLLTILRNNFLKTYHKNKGQQKLSQPDYVYHLKSSLEAESPDDILAEASSRTVIQKAVNQLPEKYKTILILYYMQQLRYKEIAKALDIPMGTVMSRLTRARHALKSILLRQNILEKNNINPINNFKGNNTHLDNDL